MLKLILSKALLYVFKLLMERLILQQLVRLEHSHAVSEGSYFVIKCQYLILNFLLNPIKIFFGILQLNCHLLLDVIYEIGVMFVYYSQNLFFISLGCDFHLLVIIINCLLKHHLIVVLLPLLVCQVVNIYSHRLELLAFQLNNLFGVLFLHLLQQL